MKTNSKRRLSLSALITCSLAVSPLLGCDGEDDSQAQTPTAGMSSEGGSPAAGAPMPSGGADGGAEGGADGGMGNGRADEGGEELSTGGDTPSGGEASTGGASAGGVEGAAPGGQDGLGGEEIIIEVAGMEEERYDPIDESIPGEGIHAFTMTDINGEEVDMRRYRNRVALVLNVASRCGYTRQYEDLQTLYETYKDRGLVLLGFPANNFGGQEPGSDEEIAEFCSANYGVTFPMFSKISVKGEDMHPLYGYLTEASGQDVAWNFNKFLVGPDGLYREHFLSAVEPLSGELTSAIEALLPNP